MLDFSVGEYRERVNKVKKRMSDAGIDVIVIGDPANMCYLSGYNAWSFYVSQALVVALDLEQPLWFGRAQDALVGAKVTTWLAEENIIPIPMIMYNPVKHPMDYLAQVLDQGLSRKTIGVEKDVYYLSARACECLQKGLPNARFTDATNLVNWVRIIKSDTEISYEKPRS